MEPELVAKRVAVNQSRFRHANETIEATALTLGVEGERIPFICECFREDCCAVVPLSLSDYEDVRSDGARFFVVPGHEPQIVDGVEFATIVDRHERFTTVQKFGLAGEIAAELDPQATASEARLHQTGRAMPARRASARGARRQ